MTRYVPQRKARRYRCPRCRDAVLIRRDGTVRKHNRFVSGGIYTPSEWVTCEGSGQKHAGEVA